MSFTNLKRGCPVCGGTRKDCRQNNENQIIHCRHYDANPVGFQFLGQDKIGFGMWLESAIVDEQEEQRRSEWKEEQRRKREFRERLEQQRKAEGLTEVERDRSFRNLLGQLSLSPKHREDLLRRGLTDEQIREGLFASVQKWQQLDSPISHLLPGVNIDGRSLNIGYSGYLCPIWRDGLIIGCQVRLDSGEDGGKYRWLTSVNKNRPNGQTSHLKNGELPITLVQADGDTDLRFAEGVLKPDVASCRLEKNFLGAAGGNFASSPEQVIEAITQLNPERLILCPDAGAVKNKNVMRSIQALHELVSSLGHELWVEWWGQFDKSSPDIDEIDPKTQTQIISYQEFLDLAYNKNPNSNKSSETVFGNPTSKEATWAEQKTETDFHHWLKLKQYTPTHVINSPYTDFRCPKKGELIFIKDGLGRGKTTRLVKWMKKLRREYGAISLGTRNSLLLQFTQQKAPWFYHLGFDEAYHLASDHKSHLACCIDSLHRFKPEDFDDKVVILDETMATIHQLLSPWLKNRQDLIINHFCECLRRAAMIICLDGNMTDQGCEYIAELAGNKTVIKVGNKYPAQPFDLTFLQGIVEEKEKPNNLTPYLNLVRQQTGNFVISSTSQIHCESMEKIVMEMGYEVLRIDSHTIGEPHVQTFLKNPDKYLEEYEDLDNPDWKPFCLIYSPSAESGVDITIENYFEAHFHMCFNLGTDPQQQMLFRIRDPNVPRYVYVREFTKDDKNPYRSYYEKVIERVTRDSLLIDLVDVMGLQENFPALQEKLAEVARSPHFRMGAVLQAISNYEKANTRNCLIEQLKRAGHNVKEYWGKDDRKWLRDELKNTKDEVKDQQSLEIFNALDITDEEALTLKNSFNPSWKNQCKQLKHSYKSRLPGIQDSEFWTPKFIRLVRFEDRRLISKMEMQYYLNNPEKARSRQERYWQRISESEVLPYLNHHRSPLQIVQELRRLGFPEIVEKLRDSGGELTNETEELVTLFEKCKQRDVKLKLGISQGRTPVSCFSKLCGLAGISLKRKRRRLEDKSIEDYYQIEKPTPEQAIILECVERRVLEAEQRYKERLAEKENQEASNSDSAMTTGRSVYPPSVYINKEGDGSDRGQGQDEFSQLKRAWEQTDEHLARSILAPIIAAGENIRELANQLFEANSLLFMWVTELCPATENSFLT